jgi:hypothetical protein
MSPNKIGGNRSKKPYFRLYVLGLAIGTLIRIVASVVPVRLFRRLEELLLPDDVTAGDSQTSK